MTPVQWQRVRELFEQALDLPAADARLWIGREASDDPESPPKSCRSWSITREPGRFSRRRCRACRRSA